MAHLSLAQAVQLSLQSHLQTRLSHERIRESEARLEQSWAALNPQVHFTMGQYNRTLNLASQGLSGPNVPIPTVVGPFYSFDSRIQMLYNFLDSANHWKVRSSEISAEISRQDELLSRQTVGVLTSLAYVQLISAQQSLQAGLADLELSEKLVQLARHQKEVGVAAGIDVTRAETQQVEQTLRQRALLEQLQRARLELARLTGLPLNSPIEPAPSAMPPMGAELTPDSATRRALEHRVELQLARLRENHLHSQVSAEQAQNAPRLGVLADYGFSGNTPGMNLTGTHNVGLLLQMPLYDGGLSQAREKALLSQVEQARMQLEDQQIQVEQEVRSAFLKLELARQQIETSRVGVVLAEKEMTMSSDRFRHGLTDSLEVVAAQSALARARNAQVQATVNLQLAQIQLAASMGQPELILEGGL